LLKQILKPIQKPYKLNYIEASWNGSYVHAYFISGIQTASAARKLLAPDLPSSEQGRALVQQAQEFNKPKSSIINIQSSIPNIQSPMTIGHTLR
jgi:hypothetical protein